VKRCGCGRKYDPQHVVDGQKQNPVDRVGVHHIKHPHHVHIVLQEAVLPWVCVIKSVRGDRMQWIGELLLLSKPALCQCGATHLATTVRTHFTRIQFSQANNIATCRPTSITVQDCTAMYRVCRIQERHMRVSCTAAIKQVHHGDQQHAHAMQ
jgi:hypothetical protein